MLESHNDHEMCESDILNSSHAWQTTENQDVNDQSHSHPLNLPAQKEHKGDSTYPHEQANPLPVSLQATVGHLPRSPRRRALDVTLPKYDTVFDWGLATVTPSKSQFEVDECEAGTGSPKKEKIKTRPELGGSHERVEGQDWEQGQQRAEEYETQPDGPRFAHPRRRKWIVKNMTNYNNLRILFPLPGGKDREGTLTWTEFSNAIGTSPFNFEVTHQRNVTYTFTRQADKNLSKISITIHKPHDKLYIQRNIIWNYSNIFKKKLHLEAEDIELENESE